MRKIREQGTNIYIEEQNDSSISLLQSASRMPLSSLYKSVKDTRAIINCSYFTSDYVLGRNQGNMFNEAPDQDFWSVVIRADGSYNVGVFPSFEERDNIVAGFSPAVVLIKDGENVELLS